jgi:hypothetical protein
MSEEEKKEKKKGIMHFLTSDVIQDVIKGERERKKKRIECWVCGREGTMSFSHIRGYTYVYCVHKDKDRCYLGRADEILVELLFGIRKKKGQQEEEKQQREGGEKE